MKDKASLTLLIDNLTRRNLVKRTEDPSDRRNNLIMLTDQGQALRLTIQPWIDEMYWIAGDDVPEQLLRDGIVLFDKIYGNLMQLGTRCLGETTPKEGINKNLQLAQ